MTYDSQAPGILSSWTSGAPGIMFSIQCKVLRSAARNRILEWPLNENICEVLHLRVLSRIILCLVYSSCSNMIFTISLTYSASDITAEDFCLPGRICFSAWHHEMCHPRLKENLNLGQLCQKEQKTKVGDWFHAIFPFHWNS